MSIISLRKYRVFIVLLVLVLFFSLLYNFVKFSLELIYPLKYEGLINKYAQEYDLDPLFVSAIIKVESKFNKDAISHKGAKGLMQIATITGNWGANELSIADYKEEMLFVPDINIKIGTWYLDKLRNQFNNNSMLVLAAYNGGSGNVSKWLKDYTTNNQLTLEQIPFKETREYIQKVEKSYKIYQYLYRKD